MTEFSLEEAKKHGLKRDEIKACKLCGREIAHSMNLMSYRITVETHALDHKAVQRAHGEELIMGSVVLAKVLGADEALTARIST